MRRARQLLAVLPARVCPDCAAIHRALDGGALCTRCRNRDELRKARPVNGEHLGPEFHAHRDP